MRSWLESGAAAGSGRRVPSTFWPSRLKMRSSSPPASASRATAGTSRRQSEDQSSEIMRILAGPPGWAASHLMAAACGSLRRACAWRSRKIALLSLRGAGVEPARREHLAQVCPDQ